MSQLHELSYDVLLYIFDKLSIDDVAMCSMVCKRMYNIIHSSFNVKFKEAEKYRYMYFYFVKIFESILLSENNSDSLESYYMQQSIREFDLLKWKGYVYICTEKLHVRSNERVITFVKFSLHKYDLNKIEEIKSVINRVIKTKCKVPVKVILSFKKQSDIRPIDFNNMYYPFKNYNTEFSTNYFKVLFNIWEYNTLIVPFKRELNFISAIKSIENLVVYLNSKHEGVHAMEYLKYSPIKVSVPYLSLMFDIGSYLADDRYYIVFQEIKLYNEEKDVLSHMKLVINFLERFIVMLKTQPTIFIKYYDVDKYTNYKYTEIWSYVLENKEYEILDETYDSCVYYKTVIN